MRIIFLVAIFTFALSVSAQKKYNDRKINGYHNGGYLTLNVLSLGDFWLPTIQPGFEYKINERLGVEVAAGLPVKYETWLKKTDSTYYNYYKLRGTLRYYVFHNTGYLGFETYFTHSHYTTYGYSYSDQVGQRYVSHFAETRRTVVGFDAKYAWIFRIGKKLYVENFIGFGPRIVTVHLPVNINPVMRDPPKDGFIIHTQQDQPGTKTDAFFTMGLQLVYRL